MATTASSATIYNGVNLSAYMITQSVERKPVFDPSNTDQLYAVAMMPGGWLIDRIGPRPCRAIDSTNS